jgi:hypothetical protein
MYIKLIQADRVLISFMSKKFDAFQLNTVNRTAINFVLVRNNRKCSSDLKRRLISERINAQQK